jgi:hypothetical protein
LRRRKREEVKEETRRNGRSVYGDVPGGGMRRVESREREWDWRCII